ARPLSFSHPPTSSRSRSCPTGGTYLPRLRNFGIFVHVRLSCGFGQVRPRRFPMLLNMSDTKDILRKIAALRQRLDQAQAPVREPAAALAADEQASDSLARVEQKVAIGARHDALIDAVLRPVAVALPPERETSAAPPRLTARAARLLHHGRHL